MTEKPGQRLDGLRKVEAFSQLPKRRTGAKRDGQQRRHENDGDSVGRFGGHGRTIGPTSPSSPNGEAVNMQAACRRREGSGGDDARQSKPGESLLTRKKVPGEVLITGIGSLSSSLHPTTTGITHSRRCVDGCQLWRDHREGRRRRTVAVEAQSGCHSRLERPWTLPASQPFISSVQRRRGRKGRVSAMRAMPDILQRTTRTAILNESRFSRT